MIQKYDLDGFDCNMVPWGDDGDWVKASDHKQACKESWNAAITASMAECAVSVERSGVSVGARNCFEIRDALLLKIKE